MSEYLFRGRRLKDKQWVYGYLCTSINYIGDTNPKLSIQEGGYFRQVDPSTVGQYIGKEDIHNKRIFDGDICRMPDADWMGSLPIRYEQYTFKFGIQPLGTMDENVRFEIIGNIHEVTQ